MGRKRIGGLSGDQTAGADRDTAKAIIHSVCRFDKSQDRSIVAVI